MSDTPTPTDLVAQRKDTAARLIDRLTKPKVSALKLLREHHTPDEDSKKLWHENPDLYLHFTERLIKEGNPVPALDLALEWHTYLKEVQHSGHDSIPEGYSLRYSLARAAVRGGSLGRAEQLLQPILNIALKPDRQIENMPPRLRVDIVALYGRILKDRAHNDITNCTLSATAYEQAVKVPDADTLPDANTFPIINAATMWRVAAWFDPAKTSEFTVKATALAEQAYTRATPLVEAAVKRRDYWVPATIAEACVLTNRHEEAIDWYKKAIGMARDQNALGDVFSILGNLFWLVKAGATKEPDWIERYAGRVVVFSGHMVDSPERLAGGCKPRFPNNEILIDDLKEMIRDRLDTYNVTAGYCSLACGSDILFAEAMLDRKAELHVVLPFAREDFLRQSVHFGRPDEPEWRRWADRFAGVLGRIKEENLHYATEEPYLGAHELYDFVNTFTQGLAVIRGRQQVVDPKALVVLDPESEQVRGGTLDFRSTWKKAEFTEIDPINLAELRKNMILPARKPPNLAKRTDVPVLVKRPIQTLLFADVAGFSKIKEALFPAFLSQYGNMLKQALNSPSGQANLFANTWGDGLHMVFGDVQHAAEFALTLLEQAEKPGDQGGVDWATFGMKDQVPLRVALHTGPVFEVPGVFGGREAYFGQHVNRAARIEPVTGEGCAYASEQFASLLTMVARDRFQCEFISIRELAKGYDRCPLYRVTRAPSRGGR